MLFRSSVMGAEGMVAIAARKLLESAEDPEGTKAQLADAKTEATRIVDEARDQADALKSDLQARAEADIAEMRERAAAEVEAGRRQAIGDLRSEVSEIALGAAERVVGASLDRGAQSALVDAYIDEVAGSNG